MPPSWWWPMSRSGRSAPGSRRPSTTLPRCTASSASGSLLVTGPKGRACASSMAARSSHRMRASFCGWPTSTAHSWAARASRLQIFSGSRARADEWGARSALLVALAQHVAHHLANDRWQLIPQAMQIGAQAADFPLQVVEPLVVAVEAGFDRRQIVAVATRLFEDVSGGSFLIFVLALDDVPARLAVAEPF